MTIGVLGRKCGMTRVFTDAGESVPVTVIEVDPNRIVQVKTAERDGYNAVQVTVGTRRPRRVSKAMAGHFGAAGVEAGRIVREFRTDGSTEEPLVQGGTITVDIFSAGQRVDVVGTSIGKGFAGVIKRYNFKMQDATHGNSVSHRAPGSIGQNQSPGRVFKGKKMSGHMGSVRRTAQNIEVIRVDSDRNLVLVKGAVPGSDGSDVVIRAAVKARTS